ncbi:MAG: SH3 domain-containing protein [Anaerolineae bacterium]|nr:SH3 domain-containing protein [Anaerolineae bacterium]MDW8099639.1 SH3 domain-containing protein [Anaerolineae bacterium]
MAQTVDRIVQQVIEHVQAVLQEDLPADLRALVRMGAYVPGLLNQLPFITIAAKAGTARALGLGRTISLKRALVEGAPLDLGYITGEASECRFTLSLWSVTRPQLERLRAAVEGIAWTRRERVWEAPAGTLNRTSFPRCRLTEAPASLAVPLAPAPPRITIRGNNVNLRAGPGNDFPSLAQAANGDQFELLGRNPDATWVQCLAAQPMWIAADFVETSIPLPNVPLAEDIPTRAHPHRAATSGGEDDQLISRLTRSAGIDAGAAILAAAAVPVTTVWRLDLTYIAYLEATQEPITSAGGLIEELYITRHLLGEDAILDTERTRRFADREESVEEA